MTNPAPARPTASAFFDPLVYLLGKHSGFRPYVGVQHHLVLDDAIKLAGFGPETEVKTKDTSSKRRDGVYRRVHFAWRNQMAAYCGSRTPYTARPIAASGSGEWALTEEGAKRAKELRKHYDGMVVMTTANTTGKFIGANFEKLYDRAIKYLGHKLPRSNNFNLVEDHVMGWFERVIRRDGLRRRLDEGRRPAPSQICAWALNGAYTDIRNNGHEPVCRVFHGALTLKEIPLHDAGNWTTTVIPRTINESERLAVNRYASHSDDEEGAGAAGIEHLSDESDIEEMFASSDTFDELLSRISEVLETELSENHDPAFHKRLLVQRFVKEMTIREIADENGLSFEAEGPKISKALDRAMGALAKAREEGEFDDLVSP